MMKIISRNALAILLAGVAFPCAAAEIKIKDNIITIDGWFVNGDDEVFKEKIKPYESSDKTFTVLLNSYGGKAVPAMKIGIIIRDMGWNTLVKETCNSACAFLWLGGSKHSKTYGATIGFHSTTDAISGKVVEANNRIVVSYIKHLGYSTEFAEWAVSTPPSAVSNLTFANAPDFGVHMELSK